MATAEWDLLEGIPEEDVTRVLSLGSSKTLSKGTVLFALGDQATHLFLVVGGTVSLTLPLRVGGAQKDGMVEERLPGQFLGWSGLIPPHQYTLQAAAASETELLALPRTALLELFSADPRLGYSILTNLARVLGRRLQVFQTIWIREMQRSLENRSV